MSSSSASTSSTNSIPSTSSTTKKMMQAILLDSPGDVSHLRYGSIAIPEPKKGEILIRIYGTAVNRADILQRQGKYAPPPGATDILGLECVGEVVALGEGESESQGQGKGEKNKFSLGERVMALLPGGGYAQYVTVDQGSAMRIPSHLSYEDAAALTEVYLTSYMIARQLGRLTEDDIVLIHAGASGVGTALIQLCKYFKVKGIIVTVGSNEKAEFCKKLGATHAVNYKENKKWSEDLLNYCKTLNKDGVSLVLDPVGASHAQENIAALGLDGRWILYGTMGGIEVEKFPLGTILRKRIRLEGTTLRSRTLTYKAQLVTNFEKECSEGINDGRLKPIIDATFTLEEMKKAHERMESNDSVGKITIRVEHPKTAATSQSTSTVQCHNQKVGEVDVFYREAGPVDAPVILLLHGFPSSSHQFRDLIPALSDKYRVIAPDFPGFGMTQAPPRGKFEYTFDALTEVVQQFVDVLGLKKYALYIFDYGAPIGLRMAMKHPERVTAIITQNGNAYEEGLSSMWEPWRTYWREPTPEHREATRGALSDEAMRFYHEHGSPAGTVSPDFYLLDTFFMHRPDAQEIQLDLILSYQTNVALYPSFQAYLRQYRPPVLAVWGKEDVGFLPAGAEAYKRDVPNAEVHLLEAGHFALDTHHAQIAALMRDFLGRKLSK